LRPYLGTKLDGYCVNPAEGEAARAARRRQAPKTPLYPSHLKRLAAKRKKRRTRAPGAATTPLATGGPFTAPATRLSPCRSGWPRARGGDGKPESAAAWWARLSAEEKAEVRAWRREHRWHPNWLRHSRATELRAHGLDVVKTILGHSKVETTQIYSEKDMQAAMELVSRIG
jgi:integrase